MSIEHPTSNEYLRPVPDSSVIIVPDKMKKPPHALIGIAGVHFVVADLSRRGMVALPTVRNTAGYDIVVLNPEGTKHATIQVKTSLNRVSFFPMPPSSKINDHESAFYALVRWLKNEKRFECFFLTGDETKRAVEEGERFQDKRIAKGTRKKVFPSVYVGPKAGDKIEVWKKRWIEWNL